MQEAGKNLERSHAMGARIANEERRLIEAVRRSEAWATCSSLVLGVEMELSIGVSTIDSFDDWHLALRSLFVCCSTASMLCMGWVAYDALLAAEEALAMAHDHGATKDAVESLRAWLQVERGRRTRTSTTVYPPLETMIVAVLYLERCLRHLRIVFSWGLLLATGTFFCYLGTLSAASEPPFYSGVIVVVFCTAARSAWKRRLRGMIATRASSERGTGLLGLGVPAPRVRRSAGARRTADGAAGGRRTADGGRSIGRRISRATVDLNELTWTAPRGYA